MRNSEILGFKIIMDEEGMQLKGGTSPFADEIFKRFEMTEEVERLQKEISKKLIKLINTIGDKIDEEMEGK